mgnify:FL=1|tara:strand:+ start:20088 stop:20270 length:183 start_codon:yes stop_codon:yes gene_type:complete
MRLLNYFKKLLAKSTVSPEERWLSQSVDLVDLERRQRLLQHGKVSHIGGGIFQKKQAYYR